MALAEAEFRLKEWGYWKVKDMSGEVGWPSQSTIVTACQGSRATVPHYPKDNQRAEIIDGLINEMKEDFPIWGEVVKAEYVSEGTQTFKLTKTSVKSLAHYRAILENVKVWIYANITRKLDTRVTYEKYYSAQR